MIAVKHRQSNCDMPEQTTDSCRFILFIEKFFELGTEIKCTHPIGVRSLRHRTDLQDSREIRRFTRHSLFEERTQSFHRRDQKQKLVIIFDIDGAIDSQSAILFIKGLNVSSLRKKLFYFNGRSTHDSMIGKRVLGKVYRMRSDRAIPYRRKTQFCSLLCS